MANVLNFIEQPNDSGDNPVRFNGTVSLNGDNLFVSGEDLNIVTVSVKLTYDQIQAGGGAIILPAIPGYGYRLKDITSGTDGDDFAGGDRDFTISDTINNTFWTTIPTASLTTKANAVWGDTALPFPTANSNNQISLENLAFRIIKSGGTTDYTSGQIDLLITAQIVENPPAP